MYVVVVYGVLRDDTVYFSRNPGSHLENVLGIGGDEYFVVL